jgi:hypothetical protein
MALLARQSAGLLMVGGLLMTGLLLAMSVAPTSPAIYGFFAVAPAIGLGVLGLIAGVRPSAGPVAQVAAWVAALGGVAVVVVGAYAIATNQFVTGTGGDDPLMIPFALTSTAWMVGSLGVALALLRIGAIPAVGAWLVLGGTITALVLGTVLASIAPAASPLSAVPFGLGWAVVGWSSRAVPVRGVA